MPAAPKRSARQEETLCTAGTSSKEVLDQPVGFSQLGGALLSACSSRSSRIPNPETPAPPFLV